MNFDTYRRIDAVNWSSLKHMGTSPRHYQHALNNPPAESDAMRLGTAMHIAVLEPAEWSKRIAVWEGGTRRGKAWEAFQEASSGKTVLRPQDVDKVLAMAESIRSNESIRPYLYGDGTNERTLIWDDPDTGLACKGRLDRVADDVRGMRVLADVKSARSLDERTFTRALVDLGYHGQAAFYADGLAARGEPVDKVVILAVESAPPFDSGVFVLDEDALYAGQCLYRKHLDRLAECRASGKWPGRFQHEHILRLPEWAYPEEESPVGALGLTGLEER